MKAADVERGGFFTKKTGTYVYIRISESSANFLGLDPTKVYGVSFNGNTCSIDANKEVKESTVEAFLANIKEGQDFDAFLTNGRSHGQE